MSKKFNSVEEELEYLRQRDLDFIRTEQEFTEFEETSKQIEDQLEADSKAKGKTISRLQQDLSDLKEDFLEKHKTSQEIIQSLEADLKTAKLTVTNLTTKLVNIETDNDDLVRKQREDSAQIQRQKLSTDKYVEDLALIQSEYDDLKSKHQEITHRLNQQVRELLEEVEVLKNQPARVVEKEVVAQPMPVDSGETAVAPSRSGNDINGTMDRINAIIKSIDAKVNPRGLNNLTGSRSSLDLGLKGVDSPKGSFKMEYKPTPKPTAVNTEAEDDVI